ncbi:MAG: bifunctional riboflavin kinase/FAD synthetase [Thermoanaerobaculia bacterium]|nr:bifunctional riboflavin kinase/FAD synthetase [Thermoanaerobaculia bacterium]
MQVVADAFGPCDLPSPAVVTVGNYDGIHRGQRAVLDRVVARARALGLPAVLVTFEPHPLTVLAPHLAPATLLTREQKVQLLAAAGVDLMAVIPFTAEFAATRAESFVREFLAGRLGVRELYVGRQFAFGKDREGDLALLARLGAELGFAVHGLEEERADGHPVSSTRIRRALAEGEVEVAAELLGRPYSLTGRIVEGDRLGRRLGWPTVNLAPEGELLPLEGVYVTGVRFLGSEEPAGTFDSVTNLGRRPTVDGSRRRVVESHILDFDRDVYGARIELFFRKRLRDEMLFASVTELSAQIGRDVSLSREYFALLRRSHGSTGRGSAI